MSNSSTGPTTTPAATETVAAPEPVADVAPAEPVTEAPVEPVVEAAVEPVTEAVTEPVVEPVVEAEPTWAGPADQAALDALISDAVAAAVGEKAGELETVSASVTTLTAERDALVTALAEARTVASLREAALSAGAVNIDQVLALVPRTSLTVAEDGTVGGAEQTVAAFLDANPHFVTPKAPRVAPVEGSGKKETQVGFITKEQAEEMAKDPAVYRANRDAILASAVRW